MPVLTAATAGDTVFSLLAKQNALLGGVGAVAYDNEFSLLAKNNGLIQAGGLGGGGPGAAINDFLYDREDYTDINIIGADSNHANLIGNFTTSQGAIGGSFGPWETGHQGIIQLRAASGVNTVMQRNFGYGSVSALDLTKVNKFVMRTVIKIDSLYLSYSGGGEQSWGILSQANPICGAQISIAPGFLGTDSVVAGPNPIAGTYQQAESSIMQDVSCPNFTILANTWYDSMIVWTPTAVSFYMRPFTVDGSAAWTFLRTNTQFIGTGMPVYIEHSAKNYGDAVSRSLFVDLTEYYISGGVGSAKRYMGSSLLNY